MILFNAEYIENGTKQSYTYNGRPIEIVRCIERRHFYRPSTTTNEAFKVTPLFEAEYLRNG